MTAHAWPGEPAEVPHEKTAVTVVIPTRNRLELVRRCLESVRRQEGVQVQVVVVDDGSAKPTAEALDGLADPGVRVTHHPESLGVSRARNAGLARVESPWVAFLDDDDYWAPDKLRSQLAALAQVAGAGWSCVGAVHVDETLQPLFWQQPPTGDEALCLLSREGGIPGGGSGVLVSTAVARRVGGFDPSFSIFADWDFYYRLALASPVAPVHRPLVGYYRHSDSMFNDPKRLDRELQDLGRKHLGGPAPLRPDYADWAVRLLLMSLRSRNPRLMRWALGSEALLLAGTWALLRAAARNVRERFVTGRREPPPEWRGESLSWLQHPSMYVTQER